MNTRGGTFVCFSNILQINEVRCFFFSLSSSSSFSEKERAREITKWQGHTPGSLNDQYVYIILLTDLKIYANLDIVILTDVTYM